MSIDNNPAKFDAAPESTEHLLNGLFTPGEKQAFTAPEQISDRELLLQNEKLIAEVQAHAGRIAAAAVQTLKGMPESYQQTFFDGISCFNGKDDVIYNALRQQWSGSDVKTA